MTGNKSANSNQFISLPKGGGALHGIGEKFSPDLHTGTGNFTVPIALPPGRNSFQPQLNLVYSTGNGNGPFGLGWQLSIPNVTRKTSNGIPQYHDNSVYIKDWDTFILSAAEDLVPVGLWEYDDRVTTALTSKKLKEIDRPLTAEDFAQAPVIEFRPRTEGLFARIYYHRHNNDEYWEVRSKDGMVSFYGTPVKARSDQAVIADPANRSRVFTWNITRTIDPFGNLIDYIYECDAVQTDGPHHWDKAYLSEIRYIDYGNDPTSPQFLAKVKFSYEERPDKFSTYRAGFEVRTVRRCTKIEVSTHLDVNTHGDTDNIIICRTYHLRYHDQLDLSPSEQEPLNGISLLSQILVEGHDGTRSEWLPPLEFGYTGFEPTKRKFFPITASDMPPLSLANRDYEMVDVIGNGLPDILEMNGTVRYWRNLGNRKLDIPREMQDAPAGIKLTDPGVQIIDANGDGRVDLLVNEANGLSGYYSLAFVGGQWDPHSFQRYDFAPSFDLKDPEVKLLDLDGDGVIDVIRSGNSLECFFNDPEKGWKETRRVERRGLDEFPNVNFSDPRVKLGDMTGDGLQDILLVHDGSIEYWPSLGYGNWGKRLTMHNSPRFPYGYDPKRILVGDVDGDGLADIVYVDDKKVMLWINQSGNGWSSPIVIQGTPPVTDMDAIRLVDMLGNGISGVLWSADANGLLHNNMFFLDFTGDTKAYLLRQMDNHMGSTTRVEYAASTKFYIEDQKRPETRWKSPLPFPVQVVARVEMIDAISGGKLTTQYIYHHGYWDGIEREFRGFGRVDNRDTEIFDLHGIGLHQDQPFNSADKVFLSPPTETRTWFHQGPMGEEYGEWGETDFSNEFWSEDSQIFERPKSIANFFDSLKGSKRRIKRDVLRTLRGRILRTELYALDGSTRHVCPYTVSEYLHAAIPLPIGKPWFEADEEDLYSGTSDIEHQLDKWHRNVFLPCNLAERKTQWERGNEPMTHLKFTGDYDEYGQPRSQINIAVPRGREFQVANPASSSSGGATTESYLATHTVMTYAKRDDGDKYIVDKVARTTTYEIKNDGIADIFTLRDTIDRRIPSTMDNIITDRSVIAQTLNFYDGPPFQGLPFGQIGDYGALTRTESLVLTDNILDKVYNCDHGTSTSSISTTNELPYFTHNYDTTSWTSDYPQTFRNLMPVNASDDPTRPSLRITQVGYGYSTGNAEYEQGYFAATERRKYDFHGNPNNIGHGLPTVILDPLGHDFFITYDTYDLLPSEVIDSINLTTTAINNYRVLQPSEVTEPNGNRTHYAFTPLGLLESIAFMGKEGEKRGDNPECPQMLFQYDFLAFAKSTPNRLQPIFAHMIKREQHRWDLIDEGNEMRHQNGQPSLTEAEIQTMFPLDEVNKFPKRFIQSREYSDGAGRLVQTRTQAEDIIFGDQVFGNAVLSNDQGNQLDTYKVVTGQEVQDGEPPNVIVSGWQIYDNKGRIVEKYEPFFSKGWEYVPPMDDQRGQKVTMYYDPRGHVTRTINPDRSEQLVIYGVPGRISVPDFTNPNVFEPTPWETYTYDANDNAGRTHPSDSSNYKHHWNTPSSAIVDAMGRTVKTIECNRKDLAIERFITSYTYDIRSNLLTVTDALGRVTFKNIYDLANNRLHIESIDAGYRRIVLNATGNEIERRDSKGALILHTYDGLNRLILQWARDDANSLVTLRARIEYGDGSNKNQPNIERNANKLMNLLGKVHKHYDEAGLVTFDRYDFKGNILEKVRQVIKDSEILDVYNATTTNNWHVQAYRVNWQPQGNTSLDVHALTLLDKTLYQTSLAYDALNRVRVTLYPQNVNGKREMVRRYYNHAGALERVSLDDTTYVDQIAYNANGQRTLIVYGNKVMTRYAYDQKTFRLARTRTETYLMPTAARYSPAGRDLFQDFAYEYDLVGNILAIHDRSPKSGISKAPLGVDALDRTFTYDPIYRLLSATGREYKRNLLQPLPPPWSDSIHCIDLAMAHAYWQEYQYDPIGNIYGSQHYTSDGDIIRNFTLYKNKNGQETNRLHTLTIRGDTYFYTYDDNGNLVQETSTRHFEWDHSDHMRAHYTQKGNGEPSIHVHYLYDTEGQRVIKLTRRQGGNYDVTIYIDGVFEHHIWKEVGMPKQNNCIHVMDNQNRIAIMRIGDKHKDDVVPDVQYHLGDHLGSSNVVLDDTGIMINREEYFPYGETSFGSFARKRYRFIGREQDEESGLYYHVMRYYAPWLLRWVTCDPNKLQKVVHQIDSLYCYGLNSPIITIDPNGREDVIVVGSQMHQTGEASKLMFVHQAIREAGTREKPTILLFSEGYADKQIEAFRKVIDNLHGKVIEVKSSGDVVNYLNDKAELSPQHGPWMRLPTDPIRSLTIFAHGRVGAIEFGKETKNAQQAEFNASHAKKLDPKAFNQSADITSFACRTGLGNPNIDKVKFPAENERTSGSLAQLIANQIGVEVKAFKSRTDYTDTLGSRDDRGGLMGRIRPDSQSESLKQSLNRRVKLDGVIFDPQGALHPVKGGDTPLGVDNNIQKFVPIRQ